MAKVPINDPKHWRDRAEEVHTVADQLTDPDSKRRMLRIAKDYEELARRAERRLLDAAKALIRAVTPWTRAEPREVAGSRGSRK